MFTVCYEFVSVNMENIYNFGTEQTTCEEHHYPNDPYYTVKGSCPLKYSLDFDSVKNSKRIDNLYDLLDITEISKIMWIYFFTALIAVCLIVYLFYVIISHCLTDLHSQTSARKSPTYLHDDYDTMRNDPNNTTMSDDVEFFCEPANVLENMWEEPPPPYTTLYPSSNSSYGEAPSCGFRPGYFPQALSPPEFYPPFDVTQEYRHQTYCDEEDGKFCVTVPLNQ